MTKVEFYNNENSVDVYVNDNLYGELFHDNGPEWYLVEYENGERGLSNSDVTYYDELEKTEDEIKFEIEENN